MSRRLGRRRSATDRRALQLRDVLHADLPASPLAVRRDELVPDVVSAYGNDDVGDCTVAALAYLVETWSDHGARSALMSVDDVVRTYSDVSGFIPGRPETDIGCDMLSVLRNWRRRGADGVSGRVVDAYAAVSYHDVEEVATAVYLFGGVYVGLQLPLQAQRETTWTSPTSLLGEATPGSWGGHAVACCRCDRTGAWLRTWGKLQRIEWGWWRAYVDECYAIVSPDWLHEGLTTNGLDLEKLEAYLAAL